MILYSALLTPSMVSERVYDIFVFIDVNEYKIDSCLLQSVGI